MKSPPRSRNVLTLLLLCVSCRRLLPAQAQAASGAAQAIHQAEHLRALHDDNAAAALLEESLRRFPDEARLLTESARVKLDQSDRSAARSLLARALDASPNSIEANDLLGTLLLEDHHYPEAMDRFETVLAVARDDPEAANGELAAARSLALQAKAAGKLEAALLCLEHASEKLSGNVILLTDIGIVAGDLHLYQRAERSLSAALALEPGNPRALYAAGRLATDSQHLPEAETYLRAYLAVKPDDATAHFGLGRVLALQLKTSGARQEFERSILLQPGQTASFYELGLLAMNAGQADRARDLFGKVLARDPKHGGALAGLGQLSYRVKDYPAARTRLLAAVAASPAYQPAHYYLGLTLARLGEREASQQELARAADLAAKQQSKAEPVPSEIVP